jgi:hypothetical protein
VGGFSGWRWDGRCGRHLKDEHIAHVDDVRSNEPSLTAKPGVKTGAIETIFETMGRLPWPRPNGKT